MISRQIKRLLAVYLLSRRRRTRKAAAAAKKRTNSKRRWWVRPFLQGRPEKGHFFSMVEDLRQRDREWYYRYMRMSPERFDHLHSLVAPLLTKRCWNRVPISSGERLAITLRYLATGESQASSSFNYRVGRSTVSGIIREGCDAIWSCLKHDYLKTPITPEEWKQVADEYLEEWNLPHVVGALDGKHFINIQNPKQRGSDFQNYKGFNSVNLMAICDAKYRFLWVDIVSYGRENDAAVFGRSDIAKLLETGDAGLPAADEEGGLNLPYYLVGDEIFPLHQWLMKPYPGKNLTLDQQIYNYRLSRARRTIENAFGILSSKFRIFRSPIIANIDLVDIIVQACTVLHNYLLLTNNAKYLPSGFADSYDSSGNITDGAWKREPPAEGLVPLCNQGNWNAPNVAKATRDMLRTYMYVTSDEGSVSWQHAHVTDVGPIKE